MSLWYALVLLLLTTALGEHESDGQSRGEECVLPPTKYYKEKCSIYMAPSSVRGLDGMGLFTTEAMMEGEDLLSDYDGPSIPVFDFRPTWLKFDELAEVRSSWIRLFGEYWWGRGVPDHTSYEAEKVMDFQITFGALPNHHCMLNSINYKYLPPGYDDTLVDALASPGIGAMSYHNGRNFFVKRNLTAGSELFLNYGYCNKDNADDHPEWVKYVPSSQDFRFAASRTAHIWDSIEGELSDETHINRTIIELRNATTNSLVRNLIPESASQFKEVIEGLNRWDSDELMRRIATLVGATPRSPAWIRENGLCVENLIPGKSQIAHAGRGAFAQFALSKDEIIVPVPLLHIINRDVLIMTDESQDTIGTQLLLNYCFGHTESSLLLCPLTNAILINHCSARNPDPACKDGPNAKVQWASAWDKMNPRWTELTLEELAMKDNRGLSMEIVALRDIPAGEEVFIDYGEIWERAWEEHVASWTPPRRSEGYISATNANADPERALVNFLSHDLRTMRTHPNLYTACSFDASIVDPPSATSVRNPDWWMALTDEELLQTYATDGSIYSRDYGRHRDDTHWRCYVIAPDGDNTYTVRIAYKRIRAPVFLTKYPRDSIHFFHHQYASDQHLQQAFRHHIGIPDVMMPSQWKNRFGDNNRE